MVHYLYCDLFPHFLKFCDILVMAIRIINNVIIFQIGGHFVSLLDWAYSPERPGLTCRKK